MNMSDGGVFSRAQGVPDFAPIGTYQLTYGRTDQQGQPVIEQVNAAGLTAYVERPVHGAIPN